ncbi:MAG: hypothetical protein WDO24_25945 [Pseudomonadota bacterium]
MRWVLDQPQVASAIIGARTVDQLRDTLGAAGWQLPEAARLRLDKISALPHRFPRAMEEPMLERRNRAIQIPRKPA